MPEKQAEVNRGIPDDGTRAWREGAFSTITFTDLARTSGAFGYVALTQRAHERASIYPLSRYIRGEETLDTRTPGLVQDVSGHRAAC